MTFKLDIQNVPRFEPRHFVPEDIALSDPQQVVSIFERLLHIPVRSKEELISWLNMRSELDSVIDHYGSVLYINMTCQTDDSARAQEYQQFTQCILPAIKPLENRLNEHYLRLLEKYPLHDDFYAIMNRRIQNDMMLFKEQNIPLLKDLALLSQKYQTICGGMTIQFANKEFNLPEMAKFLLDSDRNLREKAWRAISTRRLQESRPLDDLYNQMISLRHRIAQQAGFSDFTNYQFTAYHRFDYFPDDCKRYHETVERVVLPVWRKILAKRATQLRLKQVRPWDLNVDLAGKEPLTPFSHIFELQSGVSNMLTRLDKDFGIQFQGLIENGLLDLATRKGKAPGGYQSFLAEIRKPFIFMNAVGIDDDVWTLLHESGHAFHSLACAHQPLFEYRHGPMEFNEVASMAMELMAGESIDVFYNEFDKKRSRYRHFEDIVFILLWVAIIDSFQQWIYCHPNHSIQERQSAWIRIYDRFGGNLLDWHGLEEAKACLWQKQLHIFEAPFYYIEYGIAQLGALQLWLKFRQDRNATLKQYCQALSLGGAVSLPQLFETAGIVFDFSEKTVQPLIDFVQKELNLP